MVKSIRIWTGSGFLSCSKQVSLSCPRSDRHLTGAWMMADEANDTVRSNLLWTNLIKKFQRAWWRVWSWLLTTGCSWGLFTRLNGGTSCTSVLPELMSYLSMRFVRAVKNLPEYNSAEDINPQKMYKLFLSLLKVNTDARIDASVWLLSRKESYFHIPIDTQGVLSHISTSKKK